MSVQTPLEDVQQLIAELFRKVSDLEASLVIAEQAKDGGKVSFLGTQLEQLAVQGTALYKERVALREKENLLLRARQEDANSERKRHRVSSSYTERLRNLPSASQMSQIVMRQQQGCLHFNFHLQQPFLKGVTEPLYLNYRCEAKQVPIRLLHPVFGRFVRLSETMEPEPSILLLVEELCASARYYYAGEKHYQPVFEKLLQGFLNTTGAGTLQGLSVGTNNSTTDTSLAGSFGLVLVGKFKDHLDELAQPEALRYYDQLWENRFQPMHSHSFAASFILELMGSHLSLGRESPI